MVSPYLLPKHKATRQEELFTKFASTQLVPVQSILPPSIRYAFSQLKDGSTVCLWTPAAYIGNTFEPRLKGGVNKVSLDAEFQSSSSSY